MTVDKGLTNPPPKAHELLPRGDGHTVAYHHVAASERSQGQPGVIFCSGFKSDMGGTKALALDLWARETGHGFIRFDYFGHGASSGDFVEGTIGRWLDDTLAVIDRLAKGPQILVGSSMGGWIALLAGLARPERVAGLALVAPAADFTEELIWKDMEFEARETMVREGVLIEPSHYEDGDYPITHRLIVEGRNHLILGSEISLAMPVRILQGMQDPDVPWQHALRTTEALTGPDTVLTLIKDGDHRLSRPEDIARLIGTIEEIANRPAATAG